VSAELEQRQREEATLRERLESFERQAQEAEKALSEQSHIPPASMFNFKSALERANSIIDWQKKSLAVKHMVSEQNDRLKAEVKELYERVDYFIAAYDQEKKRGDASISRLLKEQDKTNARLEEYEKFFRWNPEANKMHQDYLQEQREAAQRKAAEQKRQAEEQARQREEERARQAQEQQSQEAEKAREQERQRQEREAAKAQSLKRRPRGMGMGR
jgi:hypothetical protein